MIGNSISAGGIIEVSYTDDENVSFDTMPSIWLSHVHNVNCILQLDLPFFRSCGV